MTEQNPRCQSLCTSLLHCISTPSCIMKPGLKHHVSLRTRVERPESVTVQMCSCPTCITGAYMLRMQTALMSPLGFMCGTELCWSTTGVWILLAILGKLCCSLYIFSRLIYVCLCVLCLQYECLGSHVARVGWDSPVIKVTACDSNSGDLSPGRGRSYPVYCYIQRSSGGLPSCHHMIMGVCFLG